MVYNYCRGNMHKRANPNMFCPILKKPSSLAHFVLSRQYIVKCKVTDLNTKCTQTHTLQPFYLYRMGDLIRGDYWHSKVQTHTLQLLYLYRMGDLIRGDYWHSKVQTHTLQPLYLYRTGDLIRGDYWHSKVQTHVTAIVPLQNG